MHALQAARGMLADGFRYATDPRPPTLRDRVTNIRKGLRKRATNVEEMRSPWVDGSANPNGFQAETDSGLDIVPNSVPREPSVPSGEHLTCTEIPRYCRSDATTLVEGTKGVSLGNRT